MAQATLDDFQAAIAEDLKAIQDNLQKGGEGSLKDATWVLAALWRRNQRCPHTLITVWPGSFTSVGATWNLPKKPSLPGAPGAQRTPSAGCHMYETNHTPRAHPCMPSCTGHGRPADDQPRRRFNPTQRPRRPAPHHHPLRVPVPLL